MKKIVIIYHAGCSDGFGSGFAAWKKFKNKAEYIPAHHGEALPKGLKNKEIYICDFSYSPQIIKKLIKENDRVTMIDHHVSAKETAKLTYKHSYALHNSGAVLTWNYFHPKKPAPWLLRYVEDTDLWKFKLPHTKNIFAYLQLIEYDFLVWDKLMKELEKASKRREYSEKGNLLLQYEEKLVKELVERNSELVSFAGHKTLAVNSPILESQIGNALVNKLSPIGLVWRRKEGQIRVSLRSNSRADVSKIAAKYGGGGHKRAAGFSFSAIKKVPWKYIKK